MDSKWNQQGEQRHIHVHIPNDNNKMDKKTAREKKHTSRWNKWNDTRKISGRNWTESYTLTCTAWFSSMKINNISFWFIVQKRKLLLQIQHSQLTEWRLADSKHIHIDGNERTKVWKTTGKKSGCSLDGSFSTSCHLCTTKTAIHRIRKSNGVKKTEYFCSFSYFQSAVRPFPISIKSIHTHHHHHRHHSKNIGI